MPHAEPRLCCWLYALATGQTGGVVRLAASDLTAMGSTRFVLLLFVLVRR
jgi:hypothetical protein